MVYYVYVLQSDVDQSYYKGFSENPLQRLAKHNNQESQYTSSKIPWRLVHLESFATKKEALVREKKLKKYSHLQLEQLINSSKNGLKDFLAAHFL